MSGRDEAVERQLRHGAIAPAEAEARPRLSRGERALIAFGLLVLLYFLGRGLI